MQKIDHEISEQDEGCIVKTPWGLVRLIVESDGILILTNNPMKLTPRASNSVHLDQSR